MKSPEGDSQRSDESDGQAGSALGGLDLSGEAGEEIAMNLTRLALGSLSVAELRDPRYGLTRSGAIELRVDAKSFSDLKRLATG